MSETSYKAPRWAWWVATGFGSGYLKPAPGTWGSLASIPFWLLAFRLCNRLGTSASPWWAEALFILLPLAILMLGYGLLASRASGLVEREHGQKDPGFIVADEWVGMGIALLPLRGHLAFWPVPILGPASWLFKTAVWALPLLVPFLLFRLFDIWKPWPCKWLQALGGGPGIVLDDVAAGMWAAVIVLLLRGFIG